MKRIYFCCFLSYLIVLLTVFSHSAPAQTSHDLNNSLLLSNYFSAQESRFFWPGNNLNSFNVKERNCIQTGRIIGALAGSTMGALTIYCRAKGISGVRGPVWKSYVTGIPSIMIGSYVGSRMSEWTTKRIIKGNPNVGKGFLKGGAYGALDGAITLISSLIPLFLVGHYTDTIKINTEGSSAILNILEMSVLGGAGYGGIFGAGIGAAYGTGISLYLRF